jgi:hypothetical protein
MTFAESLSNVPDNLLMMMEGDLMETLDDPNLLQTLPNAERSQLENDLSNIQAEMVSRGLLNNGLQGAPRTLGILSGTLRGATTSTSTSSAHGAMRAHVANLQKDPRDFGLYD